jgi:hypothetical protein
MLRLPMEALVALVVVAQERHLNLHQVVLAL